MKASSASTIAVLVVALTILVAISTADSSEQTEPVFSARIQVQLNRDASLKAGVRTDTFLRLVSDFMERNQRFSLRELEALSLPTVDEKSVRLKDIASVDVNFTRDARNK